MAYKRKSRKVGNTTITETYRSDGSKRTTYTRHGGSGAYRQTETRSISNTDQRSSKSTTIHGWVTKTSKKTDGKSRKRRSKDEYAWLKSLTKAVMSSNNKKKKKVYFQDIPSEAEAAVTWEETKQIWADTWKEIKSIFKPLPKPENDEFDVSNAPAKPKPMKKVLKEVRDFKGNVIKPPR